MMRSLRTRLLVGTIGGMVLLLALLSLTVYAVTRKALVGQFDSSLVSVARMLAASIEYDADDNKFELEVEVQQMPEFRDAEHPTYYQFRTDEGEVVAKSPLLGKDDLFGAEIPFGNSTAVMPCEYERNGKSLRAVAITFRPRSADRDEDSAPPKTNERLLSLTVARDAGNLLGQLQFLRRLLLIASSAVIILSVLIAAVIVRRGLNPLNAIAADIAGISEENLASRITSENVPEELIPIKSRLNELLCQLEESFKKERRFNADVAHELRTPLAGMRSTIEVALARKRDLAEYRQALDDCLEIAKTMQTLVSNLLTLTRLEARQVSLETDRIHLAEFIDSAWRPFSYKAVGRRISFDNDVDSGIVLESDRVMLGTILSNVLGNAAEYVDEGGRIWVTSGGAENSVEIVVSNTGCQLTAEQVSQVFDCFWRADLSRSDTGAHCGLGLALVQKLMGALKGRATVDIQQGGMFRITLSFPTGPTGQKNPTDPEATSDTAAL